MCYRIIVAMKFFCSKGFAPLVFYSEVFSSLCSSYVEDGAFIFNNNNVDDNALLKGNFDGAQSLLSVLVLTALC